MNQCILITPSNFMGIIYFKGVDVVETFLVIINSTVLLAIIGLLIWMQRKYISFSKRVFTGLGLGILLGGLLQFVFGEESTVLTETTEWFGIVGNGYVNLLMMIVVPLVMMSIIQSIINLNQTSQLGKMAAWIIGILITTTMIAAIIGIGSASLFELNADQFDVGQAEMEQGDVLEDTLEEVEGQSTPDRILSFIPSNIFLDMTGDRPTSIIAVVIFSMIVVIAVLGLRRKDPEQAETFTKIIHSLYAVVIRIVTLILQLTPLGVFTFFADWLTIIVVVGIIVVGIVGVV